MNSAVNIFTEKFKFVLNCHVPWIRVQQRKKFSPWLTVETKKSMCERDKWKKIAKDLSSRADMGQAQSHAWEMFKKCRNKVNNRKKHEEGLYKTEKLAEVSDSPSLLWKSAKNIMGWKSHGIPNQIRMNNVLITSPKKLAQSLNQFFVDKVASIRKSMAECVFPDTKLKEIMSNAAQSRKFC